MSTESRFRRADGAIWAQTGFAPDYWTRYHDVFDNVLIVARVEDAPIDDDWERVDGPNIAFASLPAYRGPLQYLLAAARVNTIVRAAIAPADAVIMRVPSPIASSLAPALARAGRPYGLEMIGDPYDVFSPGAVRHPLRPLLRWWFTRELARQTSHAVAVAYVTGSALQRRYPPRTDAVTTSFSSVHLPLSAVVDAPRREPIGDRPPQLITVGSMAQLYKGIDVLLDALHECSHRGVRLELVVVGEGKHRPELEARAQSLGLADRVRFVGRLAGNDLLSALDDADIFILVSRTEGLPQAMIEAMARGLPAIGTTVGGIPELLSPDDLVPPGDASAVADKIAEVVADPARMRRMSERNLNEAQRYDERTLRALRNDFYQQLRVRTEAWLSGGASGA